MKNPIFTWGDAMVVSQNNYLCFTSMGQKYCNMNNAFSSLRMKKQSAVPDNKTDPVLP